jgi:YfiH family protein
MPGMLKPTWLEPNWPAPPGVGAAFSLRTPGVSEAPYAGLNLAMHVGDDPEHVARNREALSQALKLPSAPCWLEQVHGTRVVRAGGESLPAADGIWSDAPGEVCAVMVADCLPVLLADVQGRCVAAVHAGWRGLCAGVLEEAVQAMRKVVGDVPLQAWLGPCIGPGAFEVGHDVHRAFLQGDASLDMAFIPSDAGRWLADLGLLAQRRLFAVGVGSVFRSELCTRSDSHRFFSYRREGVTGRMAALIWRNL